MSCGNLSPSESQGGGLKRLAMQLAKMRSVVVDKGEEAKNTCKEHNMEADYWCLDHSSLVCQHCLIFGAHRGDNAQTAEQRAYMGGCLEGLREAQAQISACTKSLDRQEGAMAVDGLVDEVRKNLLKSRGDQIESVVAELKDMETEVDAIMCELQSSNQSHSKVEAAMGKADHLSKHLSLHCEPGEVSDDVRGGLFVKYPRLQLVKGTDEGIDLGEKQKKLLEAGYAGGSNFLRKVDGDVAKVHQDDEDVVVEENNNELEHQSIAAPATPSQPGDVVLTDDSQCGENTLNDRRSELADLEFPWSDGESESLKNSVDVEFETQHTNQHRVAEDFESVTSEDEEGEGKPGLSAPPPFDLHLAQLSIGGVFVRAGGTPSHFSLSLADPSSSRRLQSLLMDVQPGEVLKSVCEGQYVLAHDGASWFRGVVEELGDNFATLLNIDTGGRLKVAIGKLHLLPDSLAGQPALAATCCLAGIQEDWDCDPGVLADWASLVKGRKLVLRQVVDVEDGLVELAFCEDGPSIFSCLQFLDHSQLAAQSPEAVASFPEQDLFEVGTVSRDQELPSPGLLMLTFKDDPDLSKRLQKLNSLQDIAATCASPPGLVTMGSAILAPYQGDFYRATVTSLCGSRLNVLFVDYGNSDTVDWWECRHLPPVLLFPTVFVAVRLALIPPVDQTCWPQPKTAQELRRILDQHQDCSVRPLDKAFPASPGEDAVKLRTVELVVNGANVADLLVEKGLAQRERPARETALLSKSSQVERSQVLKACMINEIYPQELNSKARGSSGEHNHVVGNEGKNLESRDSSEDQTSSSVSSSDDGDMTAMVDLRRWTPRAEGEGKESEDLKMKLPADNKIKVEVLHVDSPARIWLREISPSWPQFNSRLQQQRFHLENSLEEELSIGQLVLVSTSNQICRGKVVASNVKEDCNELGIWLLDHAGLGVFGRDEVALLDEEELIAVPPFCFPVSIADVEAAGTDDPQVWSEESTFSLKEILYGKEVMMEPVRPDGDAAAVVWVGERTCEDPFGREECRWEKVGDLLLLRGLAHSRGTVDYIRQKLSKYSRWESLKDEVENNPDVGEIACESDESEILSLPEQSPTFTRRRDLGNNFTGTLIKMDSNGLVWLRESQYREEVAVRLAGVRRVANKDLRRLGEELGVNNVCSVLSRENQGEHGPITGDIYYPTPGGKIGNLALFGIEQGLLEVVTTWKEWEDEVDDEDYESIAGGGKSLQLPYPLPLAQDLWLPVNLHVVHPDKPLVFLCARYVDPSTNFAQHRQHLNKSLNITMGQVEKMETSFFKAKDEFTRQAELVRKGETDKPSVGDHTLALYDGQEWCRGEITKKTEDGAVVELSDYGHSTRVELSQLRTLSRDLWLGPRQGMRVFYRQPSAQKWKEVREMLEYCAHDCIFIRVEEIGDDAEVVASFWSSSEDPIVKSVITLEQIC